MIDEAKKIGLKTYIRDDGRYWRQRDEAKLLKKLAKWDGIVAGFAGKLSDALGSEPGMIVAPIKERHPASLPPSAVPRHEPHHRKKSRKKK